MNTDHDNKSNFTSYISTGCCLIFQQRIWMTFTYWAVILAFLLPCLVPWETAGISCVGNIWELHQWARSPESLVSHSQSLHNTCTYKLTDQQHQGFSNYVKYGFIHVSYLCGIKHKFPDPDSKFHGSNMGPTGAPCWPHELGYLGIYRCYISTWHIHKIRGLTQIYPNTARLSS